MRIHLHCPVAGSQEQFPFEPKDTYLDVGYYVICMSYICDMYECLINLGVTDNVDAKRSII